MVIIDDGFGCMSISYHFITGRCSDKALTRSIKPSFVAQEKLLPINWAWPAIDFLGR